MANHSETLKALRGSIAKWKRLSEGAGVDRGPRNCPLCQLFIDDGCHECPVRDYSGMDSCEGTPYDDWATAQAPRDRSDKVASTDELKKLALAEYRYLLKVRDEFKKK